MFLKVSDYLAKNKRPPLNDIVLPTPPTQSAVVVLCFKEGVEDHIILTKRSEFVAHHKGQIGLPGGVKDEIDPHLWQTALRETEEEIGIKSDQVNLIGELGSVVTPTGFHITPFMATVSVPFDLKINPQEIAEIFSVPIDYLLNPDNLSYQVKTYFGREYQDPIFTYKNHMIWGATARILKDMLDVWRQICGPL